MRNFAVKEIDMKLQMNLSRTNCFVNVLRTTAQQYRT
jgi:hypothetical protein